MYNFTKQNRGLFKKDFVPSLIIDNDIIEYTFIKNRVKTKAELKNDLLVDKSRLAKPSSTVVSVYIDINDVVFVDYDKDTNHIFIACKFSVSYRSRTYEYESTEEYKDKLYGIEFIYDFNDPEKFVELISKYQKSDKLMEAVEPVSLW